MSAVTPEFLRSAFAALGAEVTEPQQGIFAVALPAHVAGHFDDRALLELTLDREILRASGRDLELLAPGSPLLRSVVAALGAEGTATAVVFDVPPDAAVARTAARAGITLRNGTVTPGTPVLETLTGHVVVFRLRIEGPEREDALVAAFVGAGGTAFEVATDLLGRLATTGSPAPVAPVLPGDRAKLRASATAVALREAGRRAHAAEARGAGRLEAELRQVRDYFEALAAELREQKSEGRGEEGRREAAARLRNLERERDLRLAEVQDRHRAHGAVEPFAALALSGPVSRVAVVFQEGTRKLERQALWFPPLDRSTPPVCDACGGPLGEAAICADPAHDALLCPRCRTFCQTCGAALCTQHARVCSCGATACPVHGAACESCGESCCTSHVLSCGRCCRKFCGRHAFACGVCGLAACAEHAKRCGSCDIELCGEHQFPCDVTGRTACPRHAKACGECGETVLDLAWKNGRCETCLALAPVPPGDPAVAAAEALVPGARGAAWRRARTKTRILLAGSTFLSRFRVWLAPDHSLLSAWGGSKLFGMKKIR